MTINVTNHNFTGIVGMLLDVSSEESREAKAFLHEQCGFSGSVLFRMKNRTAIDLANRLKASKL